jgi:hypothetical protein
MDEDSIKELNNNEKKLIDLNINNLKVSQAIMVDEEESNQFLLQYQLCSSCRIDKAVVICSICNEITKVDSFASNGKISAAVSSNEDNYIEENGSDNIYFIKNPTFDKESPNKYQNIYDLELLMKSIK